jgi:hypothetical protein
MKNAHLRFGNLQFTKVLRDTTIDITVRMDRMVAEHDAENRSAKCHLLSVIGNDQEIAAIAAAISEEARFYASGPERARSEPAHDHFGQRGGSLSSHLPFAEIVRQLAPTSRLPQQLAGPLLECAH